MNIKELAMGHDESKTFVLVYIFLSVVLCTFLSWFWFIIIIGIHCVLDSLKMYYQGFRRKKAVLLSIKENRLDFLFVTIGLGLVFVINFGVGVAGLRLLKGVRVARSARSIKGTKSAKAIKGAKEAKSVKGVKATKRIETKSVKGTKQARPMKIESLGEYSVEAQSLKETRTTGELRFSIEKIGKFTVKKVSFESAQWVLEKSTRSPGKGIQWWKSLSLGDKISVIALIVSLYFIAVNPLLQGCTLRDILYTIWEELKPTLEVQIPW